MIHRGEQTLLTDQDNAIVYGDELTPEEIEQIEEFSQVLVDSLIAIGIPPCPGGIMAKNKEWRRSISKWKEQLDRWLRTPTPKHVLSCGTFVDIRTIVMLGDGELQDRAHLRRWLPSQMRLQFGIRPPEIAQGRQRQALRARSVGGR